MSCFQTLSILLETPLQTSTEFPVDPEMINTFSFSTAMGLRSQSPPFQKPIVHELRKVYWNQMTWNPSGCWRVPFFTNPTRFHMTQTWFYHSIKFNQSIIEIRISSQFLCMFRNFCNTSGNNSCCHALHEILIRNLSIFRPSQTSRASSSWLWIINFEEQSIPWGYARRRLYRQCICSRLSNIRRLCEASGYSSWSWARSHQSCIRLLYIGLSINSHASSI